MRKLVHEEVDREIANKSVNIAIKMLKPELDQLMKGLSKSVQAPVKAAGKAAVNKIHPTTGKQSVKALIRQGQGVSSIPLADEGLKDFQKIAKKYGVSLSKQLKTMNLLKRMIRLWYAYLEERILFYWLNVSKN